MTTNIELAAKIIKSGGIVAFPTETVYGLGADAGNEEACLKIFAIKNRPRINPLIVHVRNLDQAQSIGKFSQIAEKLAANFWPGPLSIVVPLKKTAAISRSVTAGLDTVALRIPAHKIALQLLEKSRCPIAAPSANPAGYISATTYQHVQEHFLTKEIFILESNGKCEYGIESTIIDMTSNSPVLLRSGFITAEAIESVLNKKLQLLTSTTNIKAPGMMDKHYSPKVPIRLNAKNLQQAEIGLNYADSKLIGNYSLNLSMGGDLIEAAANLYLMLRMLDRYAVDNKIKCIAISAIPKTGIGLAINDRLNRAAT